MAASVDAGRIATNGTTATTTPTINLPGSIAAGDLLFACVRNAAGGTVAWPAGWTERYEDTSDASNDTTGIGHRTADGSEGATIGLTFGTSGKFAAIVWRLTGVNTGGTWALADGGAGIGASTTPDPPGVSPPWGALDSLFLWVGAWEGEQTSPPTGQPTNYSNPIGADSGTAGTVDTNCRVAGASRQVATATEDPGSWTISVTDQWTAWTFAFEPIPSGSLAPPREGWPQILGRRMERLRSGIFVPEHWRDRIVVPA